MKGVNKVTSRESLRVGIVGCGEIASLHLSSISKIPDAKLTAVCDKNEALARRMSGRAKINRYYTDISKMLEEERLDVIHITTPPQTHFALTAQAIEAGCHVLVEKPIALNLDETDKLIELARKSGVKLSVVHNVLFRPVIVRAKSLVDKGLIGDVIGMSITQCVSRYGDLVPNKDHWCHKLPGGIFGEMLPHSIYLATAFMKGLDVTAVHKQKLSSHSWMAADELRVILKADTGVATITNSANGLARFMALELMGTRASMHVNISSGVLVRHIPVQSGRLLWGIDNIWSAFQYLTSTSSGMLRFIFRLHHNEHHNLIKEFIESIHSNTEPPVTIEEARDVIRIYQEITSQL